MIPDRSSDASDTGFVLDVVHGPAPGTDGFPMPFQGCPIGYRVPGEPVERSARNDPSDILIGEECENCLSHRSAVKRCPDADNRVGAETLRGFNAFDIEHLIVIEYDEMHRLVETLVQLAHEGNGNPADFEILLCHLAELEQPKTEMKTVSLPILLDKPFVLEGHKNLMHAALRKIETPRKIADAHLLFSPECLEDLKCPKNRLYHPFISCYPVGVLFSITDDIRYAEQGNGNPVSGSRQEKPFSRCPCTDLRVQHCAAEDAAMKKSDISGELLPKYEFFETFWKGQGPCPILFDRPHFARDKPYHRYNLVLQHEDPEKLLEEALLDVQPRLDLAGDGIPAIRADLGTTLLANGLGLPVRIQPELQPWLDRHLSPGEYLSVRFEGERSLLQGDILTAERFYRLLRDRAASEPPAVPIAPYVPDTQGVFDLSHIVIGTDIFLLPHDDPALLRQVQLRSLEVFVAATRLFKRFTGEAASSMLHAHGMQSGVWFPDTGARISEDSCTLLSEEMIRAFCLPCIRDAVQPFGRGFLHFCGRHEGFLRMVCEMPQISTLNLGNPELYDLEMVFPLLGLSGTAYFGHLDPEENEDRDAWLDRIAYLANRHGVRLILVAPFANEPAEEKRRMSDRWHRLTRRKRP